MSSWIGDLTFSELLHKFRTRVVPNLGALPHSRLRSCRCCGRLSLILALGTVDEFKCCLRCKANLRYEMLAEYIRGQYPNLDKLTVLELDPASPLRSLLSGSGKYVRSYYRDHDSPGSVRADGAVCEDVTKLTLADNSVDLIVSSDVLEHVPCPLDAFRESARVLRIGGAHVFTVPPKYRTLQKARIVDGKVEILVEPAEFHLDPLDKRGVLVFWDYGPDFQTQFPIEGLRFDLVAGPSGESRRTVWAATRVS